METRSVTVKGHVMTLTLKRVEKPQNNKEYLADMGYWYPCDRSVTNAWIVGVGVLTKGDPVYQTEQDGSMTAIVPEKWGIVGAGDGVFYESDIIHALYELPDSSRPFEKG